MIKKFKMATILLLVWFGISGCGEKIREFVLKDDNVTTHISNPINIKVLDNDSYKESADEHFITLHIKEITSLPSHGVATIEANDTITYIPNATYIGLDSFKYNVYIKGKKEISSGGLADFNRTSPSDAKVTIKITRTPNSKPISEDSEVYLDCVDSNISTSTFQLYGFDADNDNLTYHVVTQPQKGNVTISGNTATYIGTELNNSSTDQFDYKVNDGKEDSNISTVKVFGCKFE